jgi:amidase
VLGREPGPDDLEPYTRWLWEQSRMVSGGDYLLAITELQRFARVVAGFFTRYDVWLTPTLASPPVPLGYITSTVDDPGRAGWRAAPFVAFPAIVANITGAPAMSVPLHWSDDGLPIGVHALGRFGADAELFSLAGQLERARPWSDRRPSL